MRLALQSHVPESWRAVLSTVNRVGMAAEELRQDLIRHWRAPLDIAERTQLVLALGRVREIPLLIEAMYDPRIASHMRRLVPNVLREIGPPAASAAQSLVETLRDDEKRIEAIEALSGMEAMAVPALINALGDDCSRLRSRAIRTLGHIGPAAHAALPRIIAALDDASERVREESIYALKRIGPGIEALPSLQRLLASEKSSERIAALELLADIGPRAVPVERFVRDQLTDGNAEVRVAAALAAWRIFSDLKASRAVLLASAEDDEPYIRCRAVDAMGQIRNANDEFFEAIVNALCDGDSGVRFAAISAGSQLRILTAILPRVMGLFDDEDREVRWCAIQSFLRLETFDPRMIAAIEQIMLKGNSPEHESDIMNCRNAIDVIRAAGPIASPMISLLERLSEQIPDLRIDALFALSVIRGNSVTLIPELVTAISQTNSTIALSSRALAAKYLGDFGPAAHDAVTQLMSTARCDEKRQVRHAAFKALLRIDKSMADRLREWSS